MIRIYRRSGRFERKKMRSFLYMLSLRCLWNVLGKEVQETDAGVSFEKEMRAEAEDLWIVIV